MDMTRSNGHKVPQPRKPMENVRRSNTNVGDTVFVKHAPRKNDLNRGEPVTLLKYGEAPSGYEAVVRDREDRYHVLYQSQLQVPADK